MDKKVQIFFLKKSFDDFYKSLTLLFMPFHKSYSENTLKKALHWLDKQDHNWPQHIKDSNIAVQMYLKSQKKEEEESSFQKELQEFLSQDTGAVSTDFNKSPSAKAVTAPIQKNTRPFLETKTFVLDEKSLQALERAKKELNIQSEEEALRLLIQLGQKNLSRL
ncbi:MAG: hypothetical protein OXJ52_03860 [Oligoflexia bacterium]|nr:hypothetical protein [Oligoflexia bacterium]